MTDNFKKEKGAVALIAVLAIGLAALVMATTASLVGIDQMNMANSSDHGKETMALTDGCAEDALRRMKLNFNSFDTDYILSSENGSCHIIISGNNTIFVTGQVGDYVKHATLNITASGTDITVNNWQ